MKKILFSALAFAAIALVSCSKEDVVSENPSLNQAIEFGVYNPKAPVSRAAELNNNNFTQFGVTAFYTGGTSWEQWPNAAPNFMYNEDINKSGTTWSYTPVKYWPTQTTDKLSFFAYAPMAATGNGVSITDANAVGSPKITVVIPTGEGAGSKMVDFVAAVQIDEQHDQTEITPDANKRGAVTFTMLHEMTRLALTAKLDETLVTESEQSSTVVIKSITFGNTGAYYYYPQGTYHFSNVDTDDASTTNINETRGRWDYTNVTAEEFSLTDYLAFKQNNALYPKANVTGSGKSYTEKTFQLTTDTEVNLTSGTAYNTTDDAFLFLLPPNGETGLAAAQDIIIKYDIVTKDGSLDAGYSCTEAEKTVKIPNGFLAQGKAYKLSFKFYVDQIELSASVQSWGTENNQDVDVPYSPDQAN